ncbi:MAG: hypothetical protein K8R21_09230 [Leptospira sp.]|nr:hypothetical protein [Leptospira sp.]
MLIETPTTLKDKIMRAIVGIFLFLLVAMLAVTFLPGDAERNLVQAISGQGDSAAGKIGEEPIPIDYFQAARRDCYYRYKELIPDFANDAENVNSCAYQNAKGLKVSKVIADAVGFSVSELSIKEEISKQARQLHKQSSSAGYSKEETKSADEIYRSIIQQEPMSYRIDKQTAYELFQKFLQADLKKSEDESKKERDSKGAVISIRFISYNDDELMNSLDKSIQIPEEEIKKDYEAALKAGTLVKDAQGKVESFEKRKQFIVSKLKVDAKQKKLAELKAQIQSIKSAKNVEILQQIAKITGGKIEELRNISFSSLSAIRGADKKVYNFGVSSNFLKDLSDAKFGKDSVGGPYSEVGKTFYVEFSEFKEGALTDKKEIQKDNVRELLGGFFMEINEVISSSYPVYRKTEKQAN